MRVRVVRDRATEGSAAANLEPLLTPRQAADLLQMSLDGFYAWRKRQGIPNAIKGRALRFRRDDLLQAQHRAENASLATRIVDYAELGRLHARGELTQSIRSLEGRR